jgi:hypothetical protein
MKMMPKTFPKLQIFFVLLIFFLQFCQKEKTITIAKEQFIEIYARLLIINELKIKKPDRDRLLQELYSENDITSVDIDSTISYLNSNPREWVEVYNRVREKIQKIRTENQKESSKKIDSLLSKPRSINSTKSRRKSFIDEEEKKKYLEDQKKRRKSEVKRKTNKDQSKTKSD